MVSLVNGSIIQDGWPIRSSNVIAHFYYTCGKVNIVNNLISYTTSQCTVDITCSKLTRWGGILMLNFSANNKHVAWFSMWLYMLSPSYMHIKVKILVYNPRWMEASEILKEAVKPSCHHGKMSPSTIVAAGDLKRY